LSHSEWRKIRAQHLAEGYDIQRQRCERELSDQEAKLATFPEHEEVVLWFEHDLFCQVHLIYLLNWFGQQQLGQTRLSLICVGEFPGKPNFRGLGELNPDELASLFPDRQAVTAEKLKVGARAWEAYSSSNPHDIEKILESDTRCLPFLQPALSAHLRRFPSTTNGLGAIEARALGAIQNGLETFGSLFQSFGAAEPVYGLGDSQFWMTLRRMTDARQPLLELKNGSKHAKLGREVKPQTAFEITDVGQRVLQGHADFVELNGIDLWLGGVHLSDNKPAWRWDDPLGRIVSDR
jgi:hypothetical protein